MPPIPPMPIKSLADYGPWQVYIDKENRRFWEQGRPTNQLLWITYKLKYLRLIGWPENFYEE